MNSERRSRLYGGMDFASLAERSSERPEQKTNFFKKTKSCAQRTPVCVKKSNCFARRWTYSSGVCLAARARSWMQTSSIYFCWPRRTSREKSTPPLWRRLTLGTKSRARRNGRPRERWPADLPVIEEIIDPKEVEKAPEAWRLIGAEISEQLDYEPGRFLRRRLVRRKYVRRGDPEAIPVIAALPPGLQERCIAAPGLLAQIIVSKYCDHLPLYRQQSIFRNRYQGSSAAAEHGALDGTGG